MPSKTREKLIEVARQLFALKGVGHTTMDDIANAASKGRRTIYTYFKSKRDIYNAVLEGESERVANALEEAMAGDKSVVEKLRIFLRHRLTAGMTGRAASKKYRFSLDSRREDKMSRLAAEKEFAVLSALLREGYSEGIFLPERCRMIESFMRPGCDLLKGNPEPSADAGSYSSGVESLINFIITDICAEPPGTCCSDNLK